jgi:hypothetical protein
MAIVTISRIQHRRGLQENLPQLSAAELGWATNSRRLFIGNGPLTEGAPEVGNTEILTEYSDILNLASTYTYKNEDAGYSPTTGPSPNNPTVRTLQRKFDDFVSVKDFGAKGDGETDDTVAINRALFELYCREPYEGARKALYFPAGRYIVSDFIKVPSNASLIGEGPSNTILQQTGDPSTVYAVIQTADNKQQIEGSLGTNGASLPSDISISDIGLICSLDGIYIDKCRRITLNRVRIQGPESFPTSGLTSVTLPSPDFSIGIYIGGSDVNPSEDINLLDVYVTKFNYGIWQDTAFEYFQNVIITSATFEELYEGIFIAVNSGTARNIVTTNSVFNNIYGPAIRVGNVNNFASSFNYYKEVANQYDGIGSPSDSIIRFGTDTRHSASLGDLFDRPEADDLVVPKVDGTTYTSFFDYGIRLAIGYLSMENGKEELLADNTASGATDLEMDLARYKHAQITYHLDRDGDSRSGTINISFDSVGGYTIDDDSTETADVGVVFDIDVSGGIATLIYDTTSTGSDAVFRYSVKRLNDVV